MKSAEFIRNFAMCLLCSLSVAACTADSLPSTSPSQVDQTVTVATENLPKNHEATQKPPNTNPPSGDAARSAIESRRPLNVPGVPDGVLESGMDYAYLRRAVLAHGWTPAVNKHCKANVAGDDYKTLCTAHPNLQDCKVCDQMPELSECSVDGYCLMHFHNASTNQTMEVGTYGDTTGWSVHEKDSQLGVTGLTVTPTAAQ
ncbi:hypothetical protein ACFONN_05805 [Dyella humi]|uniref:Secreted protein n=1 Tax=Dyella humi TaxID=1770547 RepID=A0ABW8IIJ7_9GAMM